MAADQDDFTEEERRALEAWHVPDPPEDLTERALARRDAPGRRRPFWVGVAVTVAFVVAAVGLGSLRSPPVAGAFVATERRTEKLGTRAVVVMEPGASLSFSKRGGAYDVTQETGDVFYRVDQGGSFVVRSPAGTVNVVGTCFRVEVTTMKSKTAGATGAALGALVTSTVLVTVYEGKVVTASPKGETTLTAGEVAELTRDAAPRRLSPEPTSRAAAAGRAATLDEGVGPADAAEGAEGTVALQRAHEALQKEKASLEAEVARLEAELDAERSANPTKTYDLDEPTLRRMAKRCELRWDIPSLGPKPPTIATKDLEKLELSEEEREVIDRKLAESHQRLGTAIRRAYGEITGDSNTGSMALEAMFAEARDKTPREEVQRVFQRLAQERAQLLAPPPEGAVLTPFEQMLRSVTSEGDRLERTLAAELGPGTARRLRDLHGGWNSRSRSSHGCPG